MSIVEQAIGRMKVAQVVERGPARPTARTESDGGVPRVHIGEIAGALKIWRLDKALLLRTGLTAEGAAEQRQTQEFKRIKRGLLASIGLLPRAPAVNQIAVTSAAPGEGKTYVSFNLARSLALEVDRVVVLIDADLPKRDLSRRLGLESARGLSDYLSDRTLSVADVAIATDIKDLYFIPAGAHVDHSAELLASPRMTELSIMLSDDSGRQLVIYDSPPILLTSDSVAVLSVAPTAMLVVRAMVSERADVEEAVRRIDHGKNVVAVLNGWERGGPFKRSHGYEYYGDYGAAELEVR